MTTEIEPDTKDWTWVLERPCPDCGFDASSVVRAEIGDRIRRAATTWGPVLAGPAPSTRLEVGAWSTAEYACHVRDVHRVFGARLAAMLAEVDPLFDDWDQDATAIDAAYDTQDPALVGPELEAAAATVAAAYDAVPPHGWGRRGRRSNGSQFTVETLGRYHLHDVEHHAWDVRRAVTGTTIEAYERHAARYRDGTSGLSEPVRTRLDDLVERVGPGGRVLEIGSGSGRDAAYLEQRGTLTVRRTDVTAAFVALMRAEGQVADVLDPLLDDLDDPERPGEGYDAVWANACLLHVERADLSTVLGRLAAVTRSGGVLMLSVKEGDGEAWSTHGNVAAPRRFVYWRAGPLRAVVEGAGWRVETLTGRDGARGERWLILDATCPIGCPVHRPVD